jgi:hypothetical protein
VSELLQRHELRQVECVPELDRAEFRDRFQAQRPVIVAGGALESPMLARWDLPYLARTAGDARVKVAAYPGDRRDFARIEPREMSLAEFLSELDEPVGEEVRYLFNNRSCVFARNEAVAQLQIGYAATVNPGLAPLAADLRVPPFIAPEEYVLAVLIFGSRENATALHYDNGGEAKVLMQVRGRKRIVLFPPEAAPGLRPHTFFRPPETPGVAGSLATVDIHGDTGAAESGEAPAGWVAELEPGDVLYWPALWFHDVENLDEVNLAVGVFVDEIRVSALLLRHIANLFFQEFLTKVADRTQDGRPAVPRRPTDLRRGWGVDLAVGDRPAGNLGELFQELERWLLATDAGRLPGLWEWGSHFYRDW